MYSWRRWKKCFGYGRISRKDDVVKLLEMLETLRPENRYPREKLGWEVSGDGVPALGSHTGRKFLRLLAKCCKYGRTDANRKTPQNRCFQRFLGRLR